jgi:hypothetical protein
VGPTAGRDMDEIKGTVFSVLNSAPRHDGIRETGGIALCINLDTKGDEWSESRPGRFDPVPTEHAVTLVPYPVLTHFNKQ